MYNITFISSKLFGLPTKKKVSLDMHFPDEEIILISDKDSFLKIIHNILSNAFKYTPSGGQVNVYVESYTPEKMNTPSSSGICLRIQVQVEVSKIKIWHIFYSYYTIIETRSSGDKTTDMIQLNEYIQED